MGNLGSILNMLRKIGAKAVISADPKEIEHADKIILPGVGAFDHGISSLKKSLFYSELEESVMVKKKPILGICLGMQLFGRGSEEGVLPGLGWVDIDFVRFQFDKSSNLKVPHMGWNYVSIKKESHLFADMPEKSRFYFVHSYYAVPLKPSDILTETVYGDNFVSGFEHRNIYGVQFHPEKSHRFGMQLLQNFVEKC